MPQYACPRCGKPLNVVEVAMENWTYVAECKECSFKIYFDYLTELREITWQEEENRRQTLSQRQ